MSQKMKKTALLSSTLLLAVSLAAILVFWEKGVDAQQRTLELVSVQNDACFSPNGDGVKDAMNLSAQFRGTPGKRVFALLLVKKETQIIYGWIGLATFSSSGDATINMTWSGKTLLGKTVVDGNYGLELYYTSIATLYQELLLQRSNGDKLKAIIEKYMLKRSAGEVLGKWQGSTSVDTVAPKITVEQPPAGFTTYEAAVVTGGGVEGAEQFSINGNVVPLQDNRFSQEIALADGENTIRYEAKDCAGNRDVQTRKVTRIADSEPPQLEITDPHQGELYKSLPIPVNASYSDALSGIDTASVHVYLNGSAITSSMTVTDTSVTGALANETDLRDGDNTLKVEVSDRKGNKSEREVTFRFEKIANENRTFVYGKAFDASTNAPLAGAEVSASGQTAVSDGEGKWSLLFGAGNTYKITISRQGYTNVYRKALLRTGEETVVDDAYLTPVDQKTTPIGPDGGTHTNGNGTVEVVIPAGALSETKNIQATRLGSAKALPGGLNETDNLQYPISFLFCADFGPDGTRFAKPVKVRVRNSWGFAAGTGIPFAYWDKNELKWVPVGMARVDAAKEWLEAEIDHFTPIDCNPPAIPSTQDGNSEAKAEEQKEKKECEGSSVGAHSGSLSTDFSIPGMATRGGSGILDFVYSSDTAYPTKMLELNLFQDDRLLNKPDRFSFQMKTALASGGQSSSAAAFTSRGIYFNSLQTSGNANGRGNIILEGRYPSGRFVKTGYQSMETTMANLYPGKYAFASGWGGTPTGSTGILANEPVTLEDKHEAKYFMVSRVDSPFGRGWWPAGLRQLHFDGDRAVVIEAGGSYIEYERGVNFASLDQGASVTGLSHTIENPTHMLMAKNYIDSQNKTPSRFVVNSYPAGTNQIFILDLGQERTITTLGLDFPRYWTRGNVWDYIKILTSIDNLNWEEWSQYGQPTLDNPYLNPDPLDSKIDSPFKRSGQARSVRYVKFELGFPAINFASAGSRINRVFAIGSEAEYSRLDEEKWPRLYPEAGTGNYILEEASGKKTVFDGDGRMIAERERSGRTTAFEYDNGRLSRIAYPEGTWFTFEYGPNQVLRKVSDSSGRQTMIESDELGQVTAVVLPDNTRREFTYDYRGLLTQDKRNNAVKRYTWDDRWPMLKQVQFPDNTIKTFHQGTLDQLLNLVDSTYENPVDLPVVGGENLSVESSITRPGGHVERHVTGPGWEKVYLDDKLKQRTVYADAQRNAHPILIETGSPAWSTTSISYLEDWKVSLVENKKTDTTYYAPSTSTSPYTRQTTATQYLDRWVSYKYNAEGLVNWMSDGGTWGSATTFTYDSRGNLTQENDTVNQRVTNYTYDANSDLIRTDYPDGKKTEMVYDARGLLSLIRNNDNTTKTIERNERGEITAIVDEQNRRVEMTRDVMGRVTKERSPGNREIGYEYGGAGCQTCGDADRLTKIVDSAGKSWLFSYDEAGRVTEMVYPDNTSVKQVYNEEGQLVKFTNRRGQEISYEYDAENRLSRKSAPEGAVDFIYDGRSRVSEITAPDFHYRYGYGATQAGNPVRVFQEENLSANTWFQTGTHYYGNVIKQVDSFGWAKDMTYGYYNAPYGNLPEQFYIYHAGTNGAFRMFTTYDKMSWRIQKKQFDNFHKEENFTYDSNGLMANMSYGPVYGGGANYYKTSGSLGFVRDASGIVNAITGDRQFSATYNPDLEIESVSHVQPQSFSEGYTYDPRGNRLTSLSNSFTYDDQNRLTSSSTHTYTYDADGNMTEERNRITGERKVFAYDSESRMVKFEHFPNELQPSDTVAEYKYDIFGRRLQKKVNNTITNFFWEGTRSASN